MSKIGLKIIFLFGLTFIIVSLLNIFYPQIGWVFKALITELPMGSDPFPDGYEYYLYSNDRFIWSASYVIFGLVPAGASSYQMQKNRKN